MADKYRAVVPMLGYTYFQDTNGSVPTRDSDIVKGSLSLGMIVGQIAFGTLGDAIGRHRIYGRELMMTMLGTLMCILLPWQGLSHQGIIAWMAVWRVVTGFGIGGGVFLSSSFPPSLGTQSHPWELTTNPQTTPCRQLSQPRRRRWAAGPS